MPDMWIECPACEGQEGLMSDDDTVWIRCPECLGEGGHVDDGIGTSDAS